MCGFIIIAYFNNQSNDFKVVNSVWVSILTYIGFTIIGTAFPVLMGLYLNACVTLNDPGSECVTTGNIISVSVGWSFIFLEVIAQIEAYSYVFMVGVTFVVLLMSIFLEKGQNTVAKLDGYFSKDLMVRKGVFVE